MDYAKISKETIDHLYASYSSLDNSPLDRGLKLMIDVYVSQLNGCAFCCGHHIPEAREFGFAQEKLDTLIAWKTSKVFSQKERLVLSWCEALTAVDVGASADKDVLKEHFSEREIVDITACISLMNALNRIAIFLK